MLDLFNCLFVAQSQGIRPDKHCELCATALHMIPFAVQKSISNFDANHWPHKSVTMMSGLTVHRAVDGEGQACSAVFHCDNIKWLYSTSPTCLYMVHENSWV